MTAQSSVDPAAQRSWLSPFFIGLAVAVTIPGVILRFVHPGWSPSLLALIFGIAVVGAAFALSWAAEVAELDIGQGLAIAILALVAVLPEYAVDAILAWKAGDDPDQFAPLATANMTGANRLLLGLGWSTVVFIFVFQKARRRGPKEERVLRLEPSQAIEVVFLGIATIYSFVLPLKGNIALYDFAFLFLVFVAYTVRLSKAEHDEPFLVGPAAWIGARSISGRRAFAIALFLVAAGAIFAAAEPFAEALVETGESFNIDEFLLLQWVAPLASETPEFLIAILYTIRNRPTAGMGTLVSSKVNQWTLLIGTLPLVFAISAGSLGVFPLVAEQREEVFLTAAQSLFGVAIIVTLSVSMFEAFLLAGLFFVQFATGLVLEQLERGGTISPQYADDVNLWVRVGLGCFYLLLAFGILWRQRRYLGPLIRVAFARGSEVAVAGGAFDEEAHGSTPAAGPPGS